MPDWQRTLLQYIRWLSLHESYICCQASEETVPIVMHPLQVLPIFVFGFVVAHSLPTDPDHLEDLDKKHYAFSYGVKDDYSGLDFSQDEKSDGNMVHGSYTVQLPDGRRQIVTYQADHEKGFFAEVSYEGTATYPEGDSAPPYTVPIKNEPHPPEEPEYEAKPLQENLEENFVYDDKEEPPLPIEPETPALEDLHLSEPEEIVIDDSSNFIPPLSPPEDLLAPDIPLPESLH